MFQRNKVSLKVEKTRIFQCSTMASFLKVAKIKFFSCNTIHIQRQQID